MKIWTESEIALLRERYPIDATHHLATALNATPEQVRVKAHALGVLKSLSRQGPTVGRNSRAKNWTEAEDDLIRRWWPVIASRREPGKNSEWLARQLVQTTVQQVRHRASVLGLRRMRTKEPPWSDAEIELLDQWLHLPLHSIRDRLKRRGYRRSEGAIAVQRYRRFGGMLQATGAYSAHQLAQLLGVSAIPVNGWIRKGWLKATPRGDTVAEHGGPGDRWLITPKAVREFLFDNAALINPRGINFIWLMDLLRNEK